MTLLVEEPESAALAACLDRLVTDGVHVASGWLPETELADRRFGTT